MWPVSRLATACHDIRIVHIRTRSALTRLILLNKPYGVICQFSADGARQTLADFVPVPGVYPAGRLDTDSEGLVVLTDDGGLQHRITDPRHKLPKIYWVQVEGEAGDEAIARLAAGVDLGNFVSAACAVRRIAPPDGLWPRQPPIRVRQSVPTAWLEVVLREGKNRQVRRMTAAVGHPTLRLVRVAIGSFRLGGLLPGQWRAVSPPPGLGVGAGHVGKPPRRVRIRLGAGSTERSS